MPLGTFGPTRGPGVAARTSAPSLDPLRLRLMCGIRAVNSAMRRRNRFAIPLRPNYIRSPSNTARSTHRLE